MTAEERQALREAISDRRRELVAEAHGRARAVGLQRKHDPTDRELQVVRLLADGISYSEIAVRLHLAKPTVKAHISHATVKMGARNSTHMCVLALRLGWIE